MIKNGWLILEERDVVDITISMVTIQECYKHWDNQQGRSYFCNRDDCAYCAAGMPRRQRWQCTVIYDGQSLRWEFGSDIYKQVFNLPGHDADLMSVRVTRLGTGRMTRFEICLQPPSTAEINQLNQQRIAARRQYLEQPVDNIEHMYI